MIVVFICVILIINIGQEISDKFRKYSYIIYGDEVFSFIVLLVFLLVGYLKIIYFDKDE